MSGDHGCRRPILSTLSLLAFFACVDVAAKPVLRCEATYAGTTHALESVIAGDPYKIESIDIGGRFRLKAIVQGAGGVIELVKIYVYYDTRRQPVIIQEAKYFAPFPVSDSPNGLTGLQYIYAPPLGRELQYGCGLREGAQ